MSEIVAPGGLAVTDLACHLGVSRQASSALLNGRAALSAEMALRFEKAFGLSADTLLRMQSAHDMAVARTHADKIKVAPLRSAA
jgi:addiction module HigA family antidote